MKDNENMSINEHEFNFISPEQVSKLTGYSLKALSNDRRKPVLFPYYKIRKKIFYKLSDIIKTIEDNKVDLAKEKKLEIN